MPCRPLMNRYAYTELLIGTTIIASKLEKLGHEVIFYDLNNMYNKYALEVEHDLLKDIDELLELKENEDFKKTHIWNSCQKMRDFIKEEDFDIIAFSVEKTHHLLNLYTMNFALIFSEFFNKPVYLGGKNLIRHYGVEKIKNLLDKKIGIKGFFIGSNSAIFMDYVQQSFTSTERFLWDEKESHLYGKTTGESDLAVVPKFNPVNLRDIETNVIPKSIIEKHPILKNSKPVLLVPYRFIIGCPKKCSFCEIGLDNFFKVKDIENIVEYFKKANDAGIHNFRFFNSNLNFTKKFIIELANLIVKSNIKISYSDSATLNNLNEEVCSALVDSGCIKLWYGTETLSDRLLIDIKKGVNSEKIYESLKLAHKAGIWNGSNLIYNFPNETDEDFNEMISFLKASKDIVQTYQCNEFHLMTKSDYYVNCSKYGIKIVKEYPNAQEAAFSDRLNTHEEIRLRGDKRFAVIEQHMDQTRAGIMSNDLLLFAVHSAVKDKTEKLKIYDDLVEYYKNNPEDLKSLYIAHPINKATSRLYDLESP